MDTTTITLTPEMEQFVAEEINAGHYRDAQHLIEDALREKQMADRTDDEKMKWLVSAIKAGDDSGIYEGDAFADVRKRHGLPPRQPRG